MMNLISVLFFLLLPVGAYFAAKRFYPEFVWAVTGACVGMIITPVSENLLRYSDVFARIYFFHQNAFEALSLGGRAGYLHFVITNGIVWGPVYGFLGFHLGRLRKRCFLNPREVPFPGTLLLKFKELSDLTFPLMMCVCRPRGLENTDAAKLFEAHCPKCAAKMDPDVLLEVAALSAGSLPVAGGIPQGCPHCGSRKLAIKLFDLTDDEKQNLLKDKFFKKIAKKGI
ncbi:MAG TPA: hypothetical protein PLB05_01125 [Candidatus Omnitrophota bacterium]|nr:hypothetical protein [Candidatus Omnitrophota bacterium]HPN56416.1 hypothetical protein [Candidatus Omnitrophota bacterium]